LWSVTVMNASTTRPRHPGRGREGKPQGRLLVSEYVGQPAAEAAQAIRRAGLRPGLERSLGCEPELVGQVVAQEPLAGSELDRNAMVTLYVAAPGPAPDDESSHPQPIPDPGDSLPTAAQSSAPDGGMQVRQRRRRKPGLAERPPRVFDTPPAPARLEAYLGPVATTGPTDAEPTEEWVSHEEVPSSTPPDDDHQRDEVDEPPQDVPYEDSVMHADNVFAGRAGSPRRRVYPARRRLANSGNQHQRRWSR